MTTDSKTKPEATPIRGRRPSGKLTPRLPSNLGGKPQAAQPAKSAKAAPKAAKSASRKAAPPAAAAPAVPAVANPPHRPRHFTEDQVYDALSRGGGLHLAAAQLLGCPRSTVSTYVERSPRLRALCQEISEKQTDIVEKTLYTMASSGRNTQATMFWMKTKGKHRGFNEELVVSGDQNKPIRHTMEWDKIDRNVLKGLRDAIAAKRSEQS